MHHKVNETKISSTIQETILTLPSHPSEAYEKIGEERFEIKYIFKHAEAAHTICDLPIEAAIEFKSIEQDKNDRGLLQ